jgi:hypothetical protein
MHVYYTYNNSVCTTQSLTCIYKRTDDDEIGVIEVYNFFVNHHFRRTEGGKNAN